MKTRPLFLLAIALLGAACLWWLWRPGPSEDPVATPEAPRSLARTPEERFHEALRDTDRQRRSARFADFWDDLTAERAAELAPLLLANEANSPFQNDWLTFLERWGALDPQAALIFADAHAAPDDTEWRRAIVRGWAPLDPLAAATWWLREAHSDREGLGSTIIGSWAVLDWRAAAAWIESSISPAEQPVLLSAIAVHLAQSDPALAQAMVQACRGRPAPPTALETRLYECLAKTAPLDTLASLKDVFPFNPDLKNRVGNGMADPQTLRLLSSVSPPHPDAREWFLWMAGADPVVAQMNAAAPQGRVSGNDVFAPLRATFSHWLAADPEAASGWLAGQEAGGFKDYMVKVLVARIAEDDPEAAHAWVGEISPLSRENLVRDLIAMRNHVDVRPQLIVSDSVAAPPKILGTQTRLDPAKPAAQFLWQLVKQYPPPESDAETRGLLGGDIQQIRSFPNEAQE